MTELILCIQIKLGHGFLGPLHEEDRIVDKAESDEFLIDDFSSA